MAAARMFEYGQVEILRLVPGVNGRMMHWPDPDNASASSPKYGSEEQLQYPDPPSLDLDGPHTFIDQAYYGNSAGQLCHACDTTLKKTKNFNDIGTPTWARIGREGSASRTEAAQYCCLCKYVLRARELARVQGLHDEWQPREKPPFFDLTESALLLHDEDTDLGDTQELLSPFPVRADTQIRTVRRHWADCNMIKSWLQGCVQEHGDKCNSRQQLEAGPASLLLIDVEEDCLVARSLNDRYFALSYVWGASKQFLTLLKNYSILCKPGSLSKQPLTQTIRDAVSLVRLLGGKYMWVDTLCIVQDDYKSKAAAILQMSAIYGCAIATIVAVSGQSADAGLPGIPPTPRNESAASVAPGIHLVQHLALRHIMTGVTYSKTESVYSSRAWTYQERLLSNRTIYFTNEQVYFQCKTQLRSEAKHVPDTVTDNPDVFTLEHMRTTDPVLSKDPFYWYDKIVAEYTTKRVGYAEDVLNAFRGIQTALQSMFSWAFYAGLPIPRLDEALLWTPVGRLTRRTSTSSFPSWCWSGWTGAVGYSAILHANTQNIEQWDLLQSLGAQTLVAPDTIMLYCNTIKLDSLSIRKTPSTLSDPHEILPYPENSYYLSNPASQRCGLLIGAPENYDITASAENLLLVRLSRWKRFYSWDTHGPRIGFIEGRKMHVENLFHSAFRDKEWCTGNVMLVRPVEARWERVAVGVMHEDAFWAAAPERKLILLK